jgi:peptidoglycan/LPS O-acetylase OafA/YrhL
MTGSRITPIDGLRTFAAFGVVWIHSWSATGNPDCFIGSVNLFKLIAILGNGVNFFFVISGFFMYKALSDKEFSLKNYREFIINRWKRIAPAFYFSAFCYALYFFLKEGAQYPLLKFFLINVAFLQNNFSPNCIIAPFWSLGTEWHFYLLLPFLFWKKTVKAFFSALIFFSALSIVFSCFIYTQVLNEALWKPQIITRFIEFGLGCFVSYLYKNKVAIPFILTKNKGILFSLGVTYLGRLCMLTETVKYFSNYGWLVRALAEPIMDFGYSWLMYILITEKSWLSGMLSKSIFAYLGKISYSVYLWHTAIILLLWDLHFKGVANAALNTLLFFTIVSGGSIVLAHFSYRYLEAPYFKHKV